MQLRSIVDPRSAAYRANYEWMTAEIERLRAELKRSTEGGGAKYIERHKAKDKLLPRERVEALLDEGSYFLEIAPLAGFGMEGEVSGAGIVGGIGLVEDRECLIIANEATAKGGATGEPGLLKNARLADIARENRLPTILLVEAAGADLPQQAKVFVPGGRGFREITRRSRMRIPTISV
ncbi:MAG TPA: carboxyl transferase domain-containing protein, partial [Candidatus Binataceae bacterium]